MKACFLGGVTYFQIKILNQYEWQGWACENLRDYNDFADVTLVCEDCKQVEVHKVVLAGQVLFN